MVGRTAFATTGVIGKANRDGFRHSWVLSGMKLIAAVGLKCMLGEGEGNPTLLHVPDNQQPPFPLPLCSNTHRVQTADFGPWHWQTEAGPCTRMVRISDVDAFSA